jgi:hypothetical protein
VAAKPAHPVRIAAARKAAYGFMLKAPWGDGIQETDTVRRDARKQRQRWR